MLTVNLAGGSNGSTPMLRGLPGTGSIVVVVIIVVDDDDDRFALRSRDGKRLMNVYLPSTTSRNQK